MRGIIIFIGIFVFVLTIISKYTAGRNYYVRRLGSIQTQYYPPIGLTPGEGGYLDNDRFDARDLIATLYDRESRGLIQINNANDNYTFTTHSHQGHFEFKAFEHTLWIRLFSQSTTFNLDQLQTYGRESKDELFDLVRLALDTSCSKWYRSGPRYSWQSRALTPDGAKIYHELLGYKEFIKSVEIEKLEHLIESDPDFISTTIPWAIIFGCESRLSRLMNRIEIQVQDRQWIPSNHVGLHAIHTMIHIITRLTRG